MRKRILLFSIFWFEEREFSYESSELFSLGFDFFQEEEYKIKKKYDTPIDESISTSCDSDDVSDPIDKCWKKSKDEESHTYEEKYGKMQGIEPFSACDKKRKKRNDDTRDDEKYLKKSHGKILPFNKRKYNHVYAKVKKSHEPKWTKYTYIA